MNININKIKIFSKFFCIFGIILISSINCGMITLNLKTNTKCYKGPQGGSGGGYFNDGVGGKISKVYIRSGAYIDRIQTYSNQGWKPPHGGSGGSAYTWNVPQWDCIIAINVRHGAYVDSLEFLTRKGSRSPKFGGNGGRFSYVSLPNCLRGIYGRSGKYLDQIGFHY